MGSGGICDCLGELGWRLRDLDSEVEERGGEGRARDSREGAFYVGEMGMQAGREG